MFQILSFVGDAYAMAPAPQGGQQAAELGHECELLRLY
jgi:hypothetical protein